MTQSTGTVDPLSAKDAPAWARGLSADEYDDGEDDGGWLGEMERKRRLGRHTTRRRGR